MRVRAAAKRCCGGRAATDGVGGGGGGVSDYVARLAEAVYGATEQALAFLAATSPRISPEEAAQLGPTWPARPAVAELQAQAADAAFQLALDSASHGGRGLAPRASRAVGALLRLTSLSGAFLEAVHAPPGRHAAERLREKVAVAEAAAAHAPRDAPLFAL